MSKALYVTALFVAMVLSVCSIGCQSTGGGGSIGSDGHSGHSH